MLINDMALNRKHTSIDTFVSYDPFNDQKSISEQQRERAILSTNSRMNRINSFLTGHKNEEVPDCHNRVRFIRESCKVFSDLWKTDKDFLNKSIDSDITKAFKEFRSSEAARGYQSPYGQDGPPSILNSTIDDLIQIHEYIDGRRKEWLDKFRTLSEEAKEKQQAIRQTMSDHRGNHERALRKFETADTNYRRFLNRSDRNSVPNFEERCRELEDTRTECDQSRILNWDSYATETYRIASEEHSITAHFFANYLYEEQSFYNDIQRYLTGQIPKIQQRLEEDKFAPSFHCDLSEHCLNRIRRPLAYPIEMCTRLLKNSIGEEGIFRIAPAQGKQKKFVAELDVRSIDKKSKLSDLGYDAYVAASALKQYLRELPDCLLTDGLLPQWKEVQSLSTDEVRIHRIGQLIKQLPKVNYDNLCHLVHFLSGVAENSAENKMTAGNLGICIGCSLLYPKEQASSSSLPASITNGSIILELMIIHHIQLFPLNNQQQQPDVIPVIQPKNRIPSNENLLDAPLIPGIPEPNPRVKPKIRAPVATPLPRQISTQLEPAPAEEISTEPFSSEKTTVSNEKNHQRSSSTGTQLDRPNGPPPRPNGPPPIPSPARPRPSALKIEQEIFPPKEENETLLISTVSNDDVPVGQLIPDLNTPTNSKINPNQTNTNRNSRRDDISSPPGEITQF